MRQLRWSKPRPLRLEPLEARELLAAEPVISEFLARNDGGLRDGDGRSSDWIEIYNAGDADVDLGGYRLTDDASDLSKWVFPSTNLEPGQRLVVFASGQSTIDYVDSSANLHTNFTLRRSGEYLGLVSPEGTVVSQFGSADANFPEQLPNVSYGAAQSTTLIEADSAGAYVVPVDDSLGASWTLPGFDAIGSGFLAGTAALGYESQPEARTNFTGHFQTVLPDRTHAVYSRVEFPLVDASFVNELTLRLKYDNGFIAYLNGVQVAQDNVPDVLGWFATAPSTSPRDGDALEYLEFNLSQHTDALVSGTNVLAIHGMNNISDRTDMLLVPELIAGASDITAAFGQAAVVGYMIDPTPGLANVSGSEVFAGFVADTKFGVDRGLYSQPFPLEIDSDTDGAEIYFTVDGSVPDPANPTATRYAEPVIIGVTTTLRAAAHKPNHIPSNVDTQTYVFLDDVIRQDPTPGVNYPATWQSSAYTGDYQMDPEVISRWDDNNPENSDTGIRESLLSLPTISIVLPHEDLWDERNGIYTHAQSGGDAWRRPGSVEYFDPATGDEFQVNAGIQMHGGASRDNLRTKKHSFRLLFRGEFGPTSLEYPLFRGADIPGINTVVLKSFFTDGFPTRSIQGRYSPLDSQYLRDTWMRDSQLAMGNLSTHSEYSHLYINGLYWGLYSQVERPDEDFLAAYHRGSPEDFDIVKDFNELFTGEKTAWNEMFALANQGLASDEAYQRIQGNNPDGTPNENLPNYLDVDALIDYMLLHLYAGAEDWPHHNWYAGRDRVGETKGFQFYTWDQEIVLDGFYRDRTEVNDAFSPARLYNRLRENAEFRLRFADRVQQHLFNDGALTVSSSQQRWMARADQIEKAIIAESARWGDAREGERGEGGVIVPTMTVDEWRIERDNVHDNYLPRSHELAIQRFTADGLYPQNSAPTLNQHGGVVSRTFDIRLAAPVGTVYYTLNGHDPRQTGGSVSPEATPYTEPLFIAVDATVKARVLHDGTWSALTEATFLVASDVPLRISEINYNPHEANPVPGLGESDADNDRFEFIELINVGNSVLDMAGVRFVQRLVGNDEQGIDYQFDSQSLQPGQTIVVTRDREAFQSRYGSGIPIALGNDGEEGKPGEYGGRLSNNGEQLTLLDADESIIQQFTYATSGDWPQRADGKGSSLQVVDVMSSYGDPVNWRASARFGGSPGTVHVGEATRSRVVINEVLADAADQETGSVELRNLTGQDIDVSGWFLSNTDENYFALKFPAPTTVPGGGFAVQSVNRSVLDLDAVFGDDLWLISTDASGRPARFEAHVEFGPAETGVSQGPLSARNDRWVRLSELTLGGPNFGPKASDVVISEVHYHPRDPDADRPLDSDDFEFVELFNRTSSRVDVTAWQLTGNSEYTFPSGTLVDAGQTLIVVGFDPNDVRKANVFRFTYGLPPQTALFGPYSQPLDDGDGLIELRQPGRPPSADAAVVPSILVDEINYGSQPPWPSDAAGLGSSLHRTGAEDFGGVPASWTAQSASPGVAEFFARNAGDANEDGRFDQRDIVQVLQAGKYLSNEPATWSEGDWTGDGLFDQRDIIEALRSNMYLTNANAAIAGARNRPSVLRS